MSASKTQIKRLLGVDFGDSRCGVALSDPLGMFAQPYATLDNKNKQCAKQIAAIAKEQQAGVVVLGMPYEMDGSSGPQAELVKRFAKRLKKELSAVLEDFELIFWDERLTSVQAERMVVGSGLHNADRSAAVDRISAALILEAYMNSVDPGVHCETVF